MYALTPRERFRLTLNHHAVDRPPADLGQTDMTEIDGGVNRLAPILGLGDPLPMDTARGAGQAEAVLDALGVDIRCVGHIIEPAHAPLARKISDTEFINPWGIGYRHNGHHFEAVARPLEGASIDDLDRFPWPDPDGIDRDCMQSLADRARWLHDETPYVVCGRHPYFGILELGCWMCGFDDFLYRLAAEPDFVDRFFDIVTRYQRRVDEIYYGAVGRWLHFTTSGDDFGTQRAPFLSPSMFDLHIAPRLRDRISRIARLTDAAFFQHTCGAVRPLIPSLIGAGVRILNPIQPGTAGMEPEGLKRDFGHCLTFYGGLDTQELLPRGTPDQVEDAARRLVAILGVDGGYVFSAAHCIQEDVPLANVAAMFRGAGTMPRASF